MSARWVVGVLLLGGGRQGLEYDSVLACRTGSGFRLPGCQLERGELPVLGLRRCLRWGGAGNPYAVDRIDYRELRRIEVKDGDDTGLGFALLGRVSTVSLESSEGCPGGLTWLPFATCGAWVRLLTEPAIELVVAGLMPVFRYVQPSIVERAALWPGEPWQAPAGPERAGEPGGRVGRASLPQLQAKEPAHG